MQLLGTTGCLQNSFSNSEISCQVQEFVEIDNTNKILFFALSFTRSLPQNIVLEELIIYILLEYLCLCFRVVQVSSLMSIYSLARCSAPKRAELLACDSIEKVCQQMKQFTEYVRLINNFLFRFARN